MLEHDDHLQEMYMYGFYTLCHPTLPKGCQGCRMHGPIACVNLIGGAGGGGAKIVQTGSGWGMCAIQAEYVCRLVLASVRTCSPFEEGILHSWIGGCGARLLGQG